MCTIEQLLDVLPAVALADVLGDSHLLADWRTQARLVFVFVVALAFLGQQSSCQQCWKVHVSSRCPPPTHKLRAT